MGENGMRVMISYNNMYGYRRNVPKLRTEPPSTFNVDPRKLERVKRTYGDQMSDDELVEHFKNTYLIGYPFYDNNFNNFHPSMDSYFFISSNSINSLYLYFYNAF